MATVIFPCLSISGRLIWLRLYFTQVYTRYVTITCVPIMIVYSSYSVEFYYYSYYEGFTILKQCCISDWKLLLRTIIKFLKSLSSIIRYATIIHMALNYIFFFWGGGRKERYLVLMYSSNFSLLSILEVCTYFCFFTAAVI